MNDCSPETLCYVCGAEMSGEHTEVPYGSHYVSVLARWCEPCHQANRRSPICLADDDGLVVAGGRADRFVTSVLGLAP